ncbi:GNAT family N-acetyltransferase [Paenibacillus sp. S3N08]|uniref:GNAT family N-acetyltransferase n=1 Tax=Paenibacillus agricola TaxID=2716264 RepID=A0ABX0JG02_9BACL|nr:GNAT family N-acetyltransferase [Paenibacillus agricola]
MFNHLELMNLQAEVLYNHDHAGRITTINEYMNQPAPRFFWGQTNTGSVIRFRNDVPNNLVHDILKLMDREDSTVRLANVINALEKDKEISGFWIGPAYVFNEIITDYTDATLVTEDNKCYLEPGFSTLLSELQFREPCFMVTENNMAVSVCFSARISDKAAEAGVETLKGYRGKGYAMRVTSSWAKAISQSHRIPLYSTSWDNYSSLSIAKRLLLHLYGTDISIY